MYCGVLNKMLLSLILVILFTGCKKAAVAPTTDAELSSGKSGNASTSVGEDNFTIVVLPDTQCYTEESYGGTMAMYTAQTNWIQANREAQNIVYVAHVGDISDNGNTYDVEWTRASSAMSLLESPVSIPYGMAVGNHDQSPAGYPLTNSTSKYNQYFGTTRFSGRAYYGGHYGSNNDSHYDLFSAGGEDYIVIYIEYDNQNLDATNVNTWAYNLLGTYASRKGIIVSHSIGTSTYPAGFSGQGQGIYDRLKSRSNAFLFLSGHTTNNSRRQDIYSGNTINTFVSDYQFDPEGGAGYMRLYRINNAKNSITCSTYSPYKGLYDKGPRHAFALQQQWTPRNDVFYRGSNNALWQTSFDGSSWSADVSLGGTMTSDPGAVSRGANLIDVVYKGSNNNLWWKSYNGTSWAAAQDLGQAITGTPAICSWGLNRLDVFYRGTDNSLKHKFWNGSSWSGVQTHTSANVLASDPAAISWGPDRIDVFFRGTDGATKHMNWNGTVWSAVSNRGGNIVGAPTVSSREFGRLDVFVRGINNQLYQNSYNGSAWSGFVSRGGALTSSPTAVSYGADRVDAFYKGSGNALEQIAWNGTSWLSPFNQGGTLIGAPAVASWSRF